MVKVYIKYLVNAKATSPTMIVNSLCIGILQETVVIYINLNSGTLNWLMAACYLF